MPESEQRTELITLIAHCMKRQYLQWNRDTVDDQLIAQQLYELSQGRLRLPEGFRFIPTDELLSSIPSASAAQSTAKKKKKKKKKKANPSAATA